MTEKTREELIEELNLPTYDKWLEHIWDDDFWWDYLVDEFVSDCDAIGIDINEHIQGKYKYPMVYFDLYHNQCSSTGHIANKPSFYDKYKEQLMSVSPVLAQMFKEGYWYVAWDSRGGWLEVNVELDAYIDESYEFQEGLFAGTSVAQLYEIDSAYSTDFETCITEIIQDIHKTFLDTLQQAYEYDSSEERYQEWINEELAMM